MSLVQIPGSKSLTARSLFLAAASNGISRIENPLHSDDTEAFVSALRSLGYGVDSDGEDWIVEGSPDGPPATSADIYCRDAGTVARFLPLLAATGHGEYRFTASSQMTRRPNATLIDAMRALGADVTEHSANRGFPFTVHGSGLPGGSIELDAQISSQYLSGVLLAAPLTRDGVEVKVSSMVSRPYVDMTVALMRIFGIPVSITEDKFVVPSARYERTTYRVEPDASTASYFLAAAALLQQDVVIEGLGSDSLQGDVGFADILGEMGAHVEKSPNRISLSNSSQLSGGEFNMRDISDTVPTLAAIAPFFKGSTKIVDVYNTRVKESDRLDACAVNLRSMGIEVREGRDWLEVYPGAPYGTLVDCRRDHRIAMSFALTKLLVPKIELNDPSCVKKTFPAFHSVLGELVQKWTQGL